MILLLIAMVVLSTAACAAWPAVKDAFKDGEESSGASVTPHPVVPESLEGALVVQLLAGRITRRQYLHAMACLAARDDVRHPLAVPPDAGSAD